MKNGPYELVIPPAEYPGKLYRGRYAYEHRVNWWKKTDKNPDDVPNSVVHHKNETKRDNTPSNLELMPWARHTSLHAPKPKLLKFTCEQCGTKFVRKAHVKHRRFCTRVCGGYWHAGRKPKPTAKLIPEKVQQGA